MSDETVIVRLVIAHNPDFDRPIIAGVIEEDTWEILPPETWDARARELVEWAAGSDLEYREVRVSLPVDQVRAVFAPVEIVPGDLEAADEPA